MANLAFCKLCQLLNQPRTHLQWYHDIDAWYDGGKHCHKPNRFKVIMKKNLFRYLLGINFAYISRKVPIKEFDFENYTIPAEAVLKIPL